MAAQEYRSLIGKLVKLVDEADEVGVSAVSCREVAYLHKRNRIEFPVAFFMRPATIHLP
jgi:PIN domain nuclease of toxin-antitoxin system